MSAPEPFSHVDLLPLGPDTTEYRLVTREGVSVEKTCVVSSNYATVFLLPRCTEKPMDIDQD